MADMAEDDSPYPDLPSTFRSCDHYTRKSASDRFES
jgi:hypothetical protein